MAREQLSLFELNTNIKDQLKESFPSTYWVIAEISEIRTVRSGHCYLELIEKDTDSDQVKAKARATIWAFTYRMLKPYFETTTRQTLSAGLKVLLKVSIEFQEVYGYSLNIKDIDPTFTLGDIARRKLEVIQQLQEDGVMDMNKEVDLEEVPQVLAVISSPTAAGYEDFINQLSNNPEGYKIYHKLFPAIMQGDEAEQSIIAALERIYEHEHAFDAVVIIRGGGSSSDLMCFDSYMLALNIAQFPLPVLTGIGHERDESVADMVAHTRLKTPTAVAEFIIDRITQFDAYLSDLKEHFVAETSQLLVNELHRLELAAQRFQPVVNTAISASKQFQIDAAHRLEFAVKSYFDKQVSFFSHVKESAHYLTKKQLRGSHQKLAFQSTRLKLETNAYFKNQQQRLKLAERTLELCDPYEILKRGYSLTYRGNELVKQLESLNVGDELLTQLHEGKIISRIEKITQKK
ncbi:exodeoxyribonuclease VII large subunit [Carboxylicivirga sediminis]|uniref:Exodeoxyribonuclease 7 large subunit n=1 Tax=Carboxylicivirga sediminis TaxID=2006564 RepID=A0A941IZR1_9BACT|nr:exodeoxyribonuclease VII large subunit [Carboxylicivirga sediminis]MBR8537524.1 exodeoxyribonuclease VII large subunit [Carboxylicivirga sediminis]